MELQGFTILREKYTRCDSTIFFFSKTTSNPKLQNNSFSILRTRFTMGYQMAQAFAPWTKFQKSLIKNCNNIISGRVIIRIKYNWTPQSPTRVGSKTSTNGSKHHKRQPGMHGRGARGAAPASNAATCEGRC